MCLLGALASIYAATLFLSTSVWTIPPTSGERALGLGAVAVAIGSLYGMWRMRRWGVILLAAALVGRVAYGLLAREPWHPAALAGPVLVLLVGLVYVRRMT